jgi:transposase
VAITMMRIAMAAPVPLRNDYDAAGLRRLARSSPDPGQVRRLLALAAIDVGEARSVAAAIGGVGLQTVRDWVVRFNAEGASGLVTGTAPGKRPILEAHHRAALQRIVEAGPTPAVHGVVRWRVVDLMQWLWEAFRVSVSRQTLSRELRALGFRKLSARPRHHAQDPEATAAFEKRMARPVRKRFLQSDPSSLRQRIRPRAWPWPRWRSARPGPHKLHGVERHFLSQVSRAPVDCQAISLPPPADIRCRAAPRATSGRSLLRRPDGRGIERFASP